MSCKSCFKSEVESKGLCSICLADYRYSVYRRNLEKRQRESGRPVSSEGKRWKKSAMKELKEKIKKELVPGVKASQIVERYQVTLTMAYKILREVTNGEAR